MKPPSTKDFVRTEEVLTTPPANDRGACLVILPTTNILEPKHSELQKLAKGGKTHH